MKKDTSKRLTKEIQIFIIQRLAMFERPADVQKEVKEIFDVEITRQSIQHYSAKSKELSKDLRELFDETRKMFIKDQAEIAIAHKSFRLRQLDKIYRNLQDAKIPNVPMMLEVLERAAKEAGDVHSNKRVFEISDFSSLSDEELEKIAKGKN